MLEISPLIMVVTFVIFLIMLYRLNQKLYTPLLKFMDDRDASIAQSLSDARNLTGDTEEQERQAAETIDAAKSEAARKRQTALEALQKEQADALAVRQGELAQKYEAFKASLEEERKALAETLLAELPELKAGLKARLGQL